MSELARLARSAAKLLIRDLRQGCGDNSCYFKTPSGVGTNGGCRCVEKVQDCIEEVANDYAALCRQ